MRRNRYGDLGFMSPKESYYRAPGGTFDAAKAEGLKRASYLSQMDQVYAQIRAQDRESERRMELEREKMELQSMGMEQSYMLGLGQIEAGRYATESQAGAARSRLDWEKEESEQSMRFLQSYFQQEEGEEGIDFSAFMGEGEKKRRTLGFSEMREEEDYFREYDYNVTEW